MEPLRVAFAPVVRPLFRGAALGLEGRMTEALAGLQKPLGYTLEVLGPVSGPEVLALEAKLRQDPPDLFLLGLVTFATGEVLDPLLSLPVPKILWALPEAWEGEALPQNALCGLNLALSLPACRTPVKWAYGPPDPGGLRRALEPTLKALRGLVTLRQSRLLWVGGPAPGFEAFREKPATGAQVDEVELEALLGLWHRVGESEVEELLEAWHDPGEFTREERARLARLALALDRLGEGYDGIALRDWPEIPELLGLFPAAALALLADRGRVVAPEGDLMGLLSQLVLRAVGGGPPLLLDLVAWTERGILLWHGGEASLAWARGPVRLLAHFNRGLPAVRDLVLRPGPVTGLRLAGRSLAVAGGALAEGPGYWGCSGWLQETSWAGRPVEPGVLLASWLEARMPHHLALVPGDHVEALRELAAWAGLELLGGEVRPVWGVSWR
ncbi:hypothetical protein [Thermus filiformis]|uniref:hypothetical protein n=1 Tax=Thermus filiformis TaxID=276 RepID=UPI0005EC0A20|nr:hypothetical protein [Thermus filiformis]